MLGLVLASTSQARRRLLRAVGVAHRAVAPRLDEELAKRALGALPPEALATALARLKAESVLARHSGQAVLGADQVLVCEGRIFAKPRDRGEARAQLRALRGRRHSLVTALALFAPGRAVWTHVDRSDLVMRDFGDRFLRRYLAAEDEAVLRSVGGYRIEGLGLQLMTAVTGDWCAIQGLPLLPLLGRLRELRLVAS
ncbi:MAG: septum formation protein Maf [Alphaproteobacteria bacterium]|nr:septum formation protein Maf [Alphaproteobacteria bacterium]